MASINWKKMTAKDLDGCIVHFDKEMRSRHKHSNENIDFTKTYLNYDMENSYRESIYKLKDIVKEIDKITPPKRKFSYDRRIIAIALETPCPDEISKLSVRAEDDFFKTIYKCEKAIFGDRVMFGGVHKDEKHTYINPITKKLEESRNHLHTFIIPYEKEYGINGRNFVTKEKIIKFNKYCDTAIFRQFGIHLNNGLGRNNWGNVESLKNESKHFELNLDVNDRDVVDLKRSNNKLRNDVDEIYDSLFCVMDTFRSKNPNEYKDMISNERKDKGFSIISDVAEMLSEQTFGVDYYSKDPMWAELEREEEERKKKRKKEEIERECSH